MRVASLAAKRAASRSAVTSALAPGARVGDLVRREQAPEVRFAERRQRAADILDEDEIDPDPHAGRGVAPRWPSIPAPKHE